MSQQVIIGGNRVGSGKKMQTELNDYARSTHNLSEKFASSASPGVLYPCLVKPAMRGDSFDIEIAADARTLPTQGALFGSYKMQIDIYQCPVRLYQALLHNNPLALGLNMKDVMLPQLYIHNTKADNIIKDISYAQFSNSCLLKYLGISGLGTPTSNLPQNTEYGRRFLAIPALAYYDIFKNYYANKQEDNAYVITEEAGNNTETSEIAYINVDKINKDGSQTSEVGDTHTNFVILKSADFYIFTIKGENLSNKIKLIYNDDIETTLQAATAQHQITINKETKEEIVFTIIPDSPLLSQIYVLNINDAQGIPTNVIALKPFPLKNIDDMRYDILSMHELGQPFQIKLGDDEETTEHYYLPYSTLVGIRRATSVDEPTINLNVNPLNGLVLKTYQNDIFNNWLNSEWIEGENGINELTKVSVENGAFSMDALNFAQKLYNMLNRVAISGGTYEDWQDVVYEQVKRRQIESPVYLGGMSQEIMFDEVIQTAPAEGKPLGEIGGRGKLHGDIKGGKIHVKCDEACFIIGIVSLTPRLFYTQGNEFYNTELKSLDDFHKPALDGIGFQDLIGERLAWWDTRLEGKDVIAHRSKVGKLPAWIEYMTSYDKAYGDFAETEGRGYMILQRNYERDEETGGIKDATTYIDPSKYNYAFADASLTSQNFWLEIGFNIKARRKMSARIIPNV